MVRLGSWVLRDPGSRVAVNRGFSRGTVSFSCHHQRDSGNSEISSLDNRVKLGKLCAARDLSSRSDSIDNIAPRKRVFLFSRVRSIRFFFPFFFLQRHEMVISFLEENSGRKNNHLKFWF